MTRAIRNLVRGCDLGSGKRVLDAGCGLGSTAVPLAETYGVHVIGLTNCEPHVEAATEHARRRGVGHLVEFHHGDFMDLRYPNAHFDAVLNHESLCYAPDKAAYLRGVRRVLRPGGRWQALDATLSGTPLSADWEAIHTRVQEGYGMPPWEPWRDIIATLREVGFDRIRERDMAMEVMPSLERLRRRLRGFVFLNPALVAANRVLHDFMQAHIDYERGLRHGIFAFRFMSGARS